MPRPWLLLGVRGLRAWRRTLVKLGIIVWLEEGNYPRQNLTFLNKGQMFGLVLCRVPLRPYILIESRFQSLHSIDKAFLD